MKKAIIFAVILAVIIGVPLLKKMSGTKAKMVEVVTPEHRVIQTSVLASGRLAHEDQVRLTSEVIAKVKTLAVEEGDVVSKGQLLLTLDDETFVANVEQREATVRMQEIAIEKLKVQLKNLEKQWQRKKQLHAQRLLDDDAFEAFSNQIELTKIDIKSAQESLSQAKAQLAQAKDQLQKTRVFAPIDGVVTSLDIKVGETAIASTTNIAGSSLMTIANPESTITEVFVDEADVANIAIGQSASVVAIAYPDTPITAQVKSIASTAKTVAGRQGLSFLVKLQIEDDAGIQLKPGMSCRAEIFTSESNPVLSIPLQAIITEEKRTQKSMNHYVFIAEGSTAKKVEVKTGISDDSFQEILSGVKEDSTIITGPDKTLRHLKNDESIEFEQKDS